MNGELRGAKGMFPASFVDSVPGSLPEAAKEEPDSSKKEPEPKVVCSVRTQSRCTADETVAQTSVHAISEN